MFDIICFPMMATVLGLNFSQLSWKNHPRIGSKLKRCNIFIKQHLDVGQNERPRGPQIEMSSLVFTIQLLGYRIVTHTHLFIPSDQIDQIFQWGWNIKNIQKLRFNMVWVWTILKRWDISYTDTVISQVKINRSQGPPSHEAGVKSATKPWSSPWHLSFFDTGDLRWGPRNLDFSNASIASSQPQLRAPVHFGSASAKCTLRLQASIQNARMVLQFLLPIICLASQNEQLQLVPLVFYPS